MGTEMQQKFLYSFLTVNYRCLKNVFSLLGSSLDYWHDVKKTGEKLRQFGATVFVASTR